MKFLRVFLNRLQNLPDAHDTVVVIDVLRSFTTAAVALDRGAAAIYPVEGVSAGIVLAGLLDNTVSVGAIAGGDPAPGFEYGNSPAALLEAELAGRRVVMSTAAGVRGLQRFRDARRLFAASLVCGRATAAAIRDTDATVAGIVLSSSVTADRIPGAVPIGVIRDDMAALHGCLAALR